MQATDNKNGLKILIGVGIALAAVVIAVVALVVFPKFKRNATILKDQKAANKVTAMIEKIGEKEITVESANELDLIQAEYDALTTEQKLMVQNYTVLEGAFAELEDKQDLAAVQPIIDRINEIDKALLTADDTEVAAILSEYEKLTEAQKALVTNVKLLDEYQTIIDQKIKAENKLQKGQDLAAEFEGYEGKWGDFGVHIDQYQGMIETAIKNKIKFKNYFSCAPNDLDMHATRFTKNDSLIGLAMCNVYFTGPAIDSVEGYEYYYTLYGEIIIKNDGSLYFNVIERY